MINNILLYNSGGGIGDSIQILPFINTLKSEFKNTKLFYLSSHENHFNSTLKDFNCEIETLNLNIKYFGFRLWHFLIIKNKINNSNTQTFDLIIDLQTKLRNSLLLKMIPHKQFISSCLNFKLSKPDINLSKERKIHDSLIKAINISLNSNLKIIDYNINDIDKKFFDESKKLLPDDNYVGFSITQGNVYRKKEWPLKNIIQMANKLVEFKKKPVFFIEKKNKDLKNKIVNMLPSALFPEHESSISSPALVTCLGKRLDFAITIDNGVMHMLSLAKVPMVSLFGPTDSEKFAPEYENSVVLDSKKIYKTNNISDITVEDVLKASRHFVDS